MQKLIEKILFILLLAAMLYQLPASIDGTIAFQDAVVANHRAYYAQYKD